MSLPNTKSCCVGKGLFICVIAHRRPQDDFEGIFLLAQRICRSIKRTRKSDLQYKKSKVGYWVCVRPSLAGLNQDCSDDLRTLFEIIRQMTLYVLLCCPRQGMQPLTIGNGHTSGSLPSPMATNSLSAPKDRLAPLYENLIRISTVF